MKKTLLYLAITLSGSAYAGGMSSGGFGTAENLQFILNIENDIFRALDNETEDREQLVEVVRFIDALNREVIVYQDIENSTLYYETITDVGESGQP